MPGDTISTPDAKALASVEHAAKVIHGLLSREGAQGTEGTAADTAVTQAAEPAPADADAQADADAAQSADPTSTGDELPPEPKRARKVKFSDGTEEDVDEDEAYLGYMRTRDYTHKTQLTAEQRKKAVEAERVAGEARQELIQALEEVKRGMIALVPTEPDWDLLRTKMTPEQFSAAHAEYTTFKRQYDAVVARQNKEIAAQQETANKRLEEYRDEQSEKLLVAIPEWHDDEVRLADKAKIKAYAKDVLGLTDAEIADISNAQVVIGLRDAMRWHEVQAAGGKVQPTKPKLKPAAPGTPVAPKPKPSDKTRAFEQQRKTGKLDDTAKVFEHLI